MTVNRLMSMEFCGRPDLKSKLKVLRNSNKHEAYRKHIVQTGFHSSCTFKPQVSAVRDVVARVASYWGVTSPTKTNFTGPKFLPHCHHRL